jgi:hypothetical protein
LPTIFISYRRDDAPGYAGRLYDRIRGEFGRENVFIDVDTLEPGDDFVEAIEDRLNKCDLMLALIGKRWLSVTDEQGRPRLQDEGDYVRIEIQTAIQRRLRTIPVLVERAMMPRSQDLPEALQPLARRQAIELSDTRWDYDVSLLVQHLKRVASHRTADANSAVVSQSPETSNVDAASSADALERPLTEAERRRAAAEGETRLAPAQGHEGIRWARRTPDGAQKRPEVAGGQFLGREEERPTAEPRAVSLRDTAEGLSNGRAEIQRAWNVAVVALTAATLAAAIGKAFFTSPTTFFSAHVPVERLLFLAIVLVRRKAPRGYQILIAAGFLVLALEAFAHWYDWWHLSDTTGWSKFFTYAPEVAFGCWSAAFARRGTIRLSWSIIPYIVVGIAAVVQDRFHLTGAALAAAGWTAFEAARQSKDRGLRWAAWGTGLWLVLLAVVWIPLGLLYLNLLSLLFALSAWLIAMSVRNKIEPITSANLLDDGRST